MIKINRVDFNVIGVFEPVGGAGFQNPDDRIVIPIKTAMYRLLGTDYISNFDVTVKNKDDIQDAQDSITNEIMRSSQDDRNLKGRT